MQIIKRAWRDTWSSIGGWSVLNFVVAVPVVGFALHYLISGAEPMSAEFEIWLIYGLAATAIVSLSLFAWNLACSPYRIQRDTRLRLENELVQVRKQLGAKREPRQLSSEQKSILADAIRSANVGLQGMNVIYAPFSEEAADFASDLGDAIRSSGITCSVHNGIFHDHDLKERGLKIDYSESEEMAELANVMRAQLKEFGILAERRAQSADKEFLYLYVARSTNEN